MADNYIALEFLNVHAQVVHGDLSFNNIMINRVWQHKRDRSPSDLRNFLIKSRKVPDSLPPDVSLPPNVPLSLLKLPSSQTPFSTVVDNSPLQVNDDSVVVDHAGTIEEIEATGMLIDCDFMRYTTQKTHQTSLRKHYY
jgi:hypothetical protein